MRHARRFGAPPVTAETVWLAGHAAGPGTVTLNGLVAGKFDGRFEIEVTALLKTRNEVWIDAHSALSDVTLEIR